MSVNGTNPAVGLSNQGGSSPPERADPDLAVVSAAQKGDLNAFEALVLKHQKRMLNIAFRLIDDYDEACEVVQDAFLSAYRAIGTFRGDSKFTTWLTSITVNLSKNRLASIMSRKGREAYSLDAPRQTDDGEVMPEPPSREPSVLDAMMSRDIQQRVQDCIRTLEPGFREVLVLRDLQEFSYEEIGGMLTVAVGTVKSRLFRARESVKECLKKAMGSL